MSQKQLSYEPLKAIFGYLSVEKRAEIHRNIAEFRSLDSHLPLRLKSLSVGQNLFECDGKEWSFHREVTIDGQVYTDLFFKSPGYHMRHRLQGTAHEKIRVLMDFFLRNGTQLDSFRIWGLQHGLPSETKLKVHALLLEDDHVAVFRQILPFLDREKLKRVHFLVAQRTLSMLEEPAIKSMDTVFLQFPYYDPIPLDSHLINLTNRHIHCTYLSFPIPELQKLAESWIERRRPIGSTFTLGIEHYDYVVEVIQHFVLNLAAKHAKVISLGSTYFAHCATVPIDEHSELVVNGTAKILHWPPFKWNFKMEVMQRGETILNSAI